MSSDAAFALAARSRTAGCAQSSKGFAFRRSASFAAAQGDMRSELWFCGLARTGDPCGRWRVHRNTDYQQLRLLVRGRRLHHAGGDQGLGRQHGQWLRRGDCEKWLPPMRQQPPAMSDRAARTGRHSNGRSPTGAPGHGLEKWRALHC